MFYRTQVAESPVTMHSRHPPEATEWSGLLLRVIRSIQYMPYNALSMGDDVAVFPILSLVTLTFDLWP